MPCSLLWRWSTKSLGRRNIGPEVRGAVWNPRACPRGDVHCRPRHDDAQRSTHLMVSVHEPSHMVSTLLATRRGVGPTRATTAPL
jgi:hypothetical protein